MICAAAAGESAVIPPLLLVGWGYNCLHPGVFQGVGDDRTGNHHCDFHASIDQLSYRQNICKESESILMFLCAGDRRRLYAASLPRSALFLIAAVHRSRVCLGAPFEIRSKNQNAESTRSDLELAMGCVARCSMPSYIGIKVYSSTRCFSW
jgi:hypothetical protein